MNLYEIIAIGWLAGLWIEFYKIHGIKLLRKAIFGKDVCEIDEAGRRAKIMHTYFSKPFNCESCMGFWLGLIFAYFTHPLSFQIIIFALLTSFTAWLLYALTRRI